MFCLTFQRDISAPIFKNVWESRTLDPSLGLSFVVFQEREVKLPSGEKSCVLHKCYPGTNHFLRVHALSKDDRILDVSKQLTVQTAAPPDTPLVTLR